MDPCVDVPSAFAEYDSAYRTQSHNEARSRRLRLARVQLVAALRSTGYHPEVPVARQLVLDLTALSPVANGAGGGAGATAVAPTVTAAA